MSMINISAEISFTFLPGNLDALMHTFFSGGQTPYLRVLKKDFQIKVFIMILAKVI